MGHPVGVTRRERIQRRRLGRGVYCPADLPEGPWTVLRAWLEALPPDSVVAGPTAAWLLGLDLDPTNPVEVIVPIGSWARSRAGLRVRHCAITSSEVVRVQCQLATTIDRTLRDLSLRLSDVELMIAIDGAFRHGLTDASRLRFNRRLRRLGELGAPAESAMETRLRWTLIQAGLPRPEVQTRLFDSAGEFVGRADLYYPSARLVIDYDGGNHRDRLVEDNRRQNMLINAGYRVLRFTAADRPLTITAQVRQALVSGTARQEVAVSA